MADGAVEGGAVARALAEALAGIWSAPLPLAERRRLCARAAAAPVLAAAGRGGQHSGDDVSIGVMAEVIIAAGGSNAGDAVRALRARGAGALAKRVQRASRARNWAAHPDLALPAEVREALSDGSQDAVLPPPCGGGSSGGSTDSSGDDRCSPCSCADVGADGRVLLAQTAQTDEEADAVVAVQALAPPPAPPLTGADAAGGAVSVQEALAEEHELVETIGTTEPVGRRAVRDLVRRFEAGANGKSKGKGGRRIEHEPVATEEHELVETTGGTTESEVCKGGALVQDAAAEDHELVETITIEREVSKDGESMQAQRPREEAEECVEHVHDDGVEGFATVHRMLNALRAGLLGTSEASEHGQVVSIGTIEPAVCTGGDAPVQDAAAEEHELVGAITAVREDAATEEHELVETIGEHAALVQDAAAEERELVETTTIEETIVTMTGIVDGSRREAVTMTGIIDGTFEPEVCQDAAEPGLVETIVTMTGIADGSRREAVAMTGIVDGTFVPEVCHFEVGQDAAERERELVETIYAEREVSRALNEGQSDGGRVGSWADAVDDDEAGEEFEGGLGAVQVDDGSAASVAANRRFLAVLVGRPELYDEYVRFIRSRGYEGTAECG